MVAKKILISGADGYIGCVLANTLLSHGYEVHGIDTMYFKDITLGQYNHSYPMTQKDIRSITEDDLYGFDAVIHLAGLSNDAMSIINPDLTEEINHKATISLAKKARAAGVKKFLFSSSCSVYGRSSNAYVNESSKLNPLTPYAVSKIAAEQGLQKLASSDFFVGLLRNSTVCGYSPKFRNDLVVNNFASSALALSKINIHSDGSPWRPLIDVRDLATVFIAFLQTKNSKLNGRIINIGFTQSNVRVVDILDSIKKVIPDCKIVFTGKHGADSRSYKVDFSLFIKFFPGVTIQYPLERTISDLVEKIKIHNITKQDILSGKFERIVSLRNLLRQKRLTMNLCWK